MTTASGRNLDRSMVRAVVWNAAAKWTSQILSWVSTIFVARLLTPYDYGLVGMSGLYLALATLMSVVGIGDAVVTLRDLTRRQIAELNTVAVLSGLGLVAISCGLAGPLAHFFSAPPLRAVVIVVSGTCVINAVQAVPRALLQKELRFKLLAFIEAVRVLCQVVTTVALASTGFRYWSLVFGHIVGCVVSTALTCRWRWHGFAAPHFARLRRELRFGSHVLVSETAWYAYDNSDFLVAGRFLGEVPLGNYTVAWTIACAPVERIANLVTGVTPAFFSAIQKDQAELRRYLLRLTEALSYVTVPASIGLALVADLLVPVLLGPKWYGVIGPLRLLAGFVAVRSITTVLPKVLTAIGDAGFVMRTTVAAAVVMPCAFFVGSRWGVNGIAATWVIMYLPIISPLYFRIFRRIEMSARDYWSSVVPAVAAAAIMSGLLMITRWLLPSGMSPVVRLSIAVSVGVVSYTGALFGLNGDRVSRLILALRSLHRQESHLVEHAVSDKTE